MLLNPGRAGRDGHLAVGLVAGGADIQRGTPDVGGAHLLDHVHLVGVDGDGHLVRGRLDLGQHVAGVVAQPLGDVAFGFRGEGDRATDLQDHVRAGFADAGDQFIGEGQTLGALAIGFATMHVEHGGTGVVAVDGLLDLRLERYRDVFREVGRLPFRTVGRGGDDQFLHVFDKQRTIDEVHGVFLGLAVLCLLY
ncbi:hypothetical protein D9M71_595010 [compost metagenome]